MIEVFALILCQIVGFAGLGWWLRLLADKKQRDIEAKLEASLRSWIEPGEGGKPSKFAQMLYASGEVIGQAAAKSLMGAIKQPDTAAARQGNMFAEDIIAQQNPLMGLLTGTKRGKGAALMRLAELLGPMLTGRNGNDSTPSADHTSVSERLRKGG